MSKASVALANTEAVFSALSHASRRHILMVLQFRGGAMTAGDIADRFSCSWPTTTRHLNILMDAGLVTKEHQGRQRIYRLNRDRLLKVTSKWFSHFQ